MPTFNPNEPQSGETVDADVLHDQFNALKALIDAQQAQINALAGGASGPKVLSGAVVIGTNNQPGPYLMSSVKYHDDFNTGAFSVEIDPNSGEVHVIVPVPNYNGTPPLIGSTAVAYAWNGPFPAPIFGTATDHNGPQLQVDGIYWRFPQTTWPQYGVYIPLQAMQWQT